METNLLSLARAKTAFSYPSDLIEARKSPFRSASVRACNVLSMKLSIPEIMLPPQVVLIRVRQEFKKVIVEYRRGLPVRRMPGGNETGLALPYVPVGQGSDVLRSQ